MSLISGSGGGCFRKGTRVQLEGGKTAPIEMLNIGDCILAFDEDGKIQNAKVTAVHFHEDPQPILRVSFWRGETFITPNHWVLNQYNSFAEMGRLTTHDALIDGMGHLRPITGSELVGYEPVYNLTVEPHHTFIADGIRVHNGGHRERFPVVAGAGGGGGKGGGGAVESPDTLSSKAMVSMLDLLGEGQIGGLVNGAKSVYFNGVPVQNVDNTWNFSVPNLLDPTTGQLLPLAFNYQFRDGQQNQTPIKGFSDVETPYVVNVRVQHGMAPAAVSITNPNANAVRLTVAIPSLTSQDTSTGSVHGTTVSFQFLISVNGGAYQNLSGPMTITGKSRARYQVSYLYDLPTTDSAGKVANTWQVALNRLTPDSQSLALNNETWFDSYVEIVYANLSYPNSALIGFTLDSSQFSRIPTRSYLVNGLYIQIPSNYTPASYSGTVWTAATYTGVWDGTFKVAVCNNPAWVLYDLLTNTRYGLGEFVATTQVDTAKLYQIAQYCDGMVPDGYGGMEPRFTINTAIQNRAEAYKLLGDISTVFNGMPFWSGGLATFMQDAPDTPVMNYSPANVVDGTFNYAGTSRKDRHSAVLVTWNDPKQYYKQVIEYVEDQSLVTKYGLRTKDISAFGCTSRGQAHRAGKWMLYTEEYQANLITFSVGVDSALVLPGDIINIQDSTRAGKRLSGRIVSCTATSATLDAPVTLSEGPQATLSLRMPDGTFVDNVLDQSNSGVSTATVTWQTPLTTLPLNNSIWLISETNLVPMQARVVGVTQGKTPGEFSIAAVEHNPSKYAYIEDNVLLVDQPTSILDVNPPAPTGLTVTDAPYENGNTFLIKMLISWDRAQQTISATNAASQTQSWNVIQQGVTSWKILVKETDVGGNWITYTSNTPNIEIPNVRQGQVFDIQVYGVNSLGRSSGAYAETSYEVGVGMISIVPPPTGLTVVPTVYNQTGLAVLLTWVAPAQTTVASYSVQYRLNYGTSVGSWITLQNVSTTSATITGLTEGVAYDFGVASVNSIGVVGMYELITNNITYPTLQTPSSATVYAGMDANGNVQKIRATINFSSDANFSVVPDGVYVFISAFDTPNSVTIASGGTTNSLTIGSADILNSSSSTGETQFTILAGSTQSQIIAATTTSPLSQAIQNADFAGEFWANFGTSLWRRISRADATSFYFDEPFDIAPTTGEAMNWMQVSWHDERGTGVPGDFGGDYRLACLQNGSNYEIIRWSDVVDNAGSFQIACQRGLEGTTPIVADGLTLHYFPAPGPGTTMIYIPTASFTQSGTSFTADAEAFIQIPKDYYGSISVCTYRNSNGQVLRSDIIPATFGGTL